SRNRGVKILRDIVVERQALAPDQSKNDFAGGRRAHINHHQIAIAWVAEMMVDVNPDFGGTNRSKRGSQSVLNCRVERDSDIDVFRGGRRLGKQFRSWQK